MTGVMPARVQCTINNNNNGNNNAGLMHNWKKMRQRR
jgi:hypothetical protein